MDTQHIVDQIEDVYQTIDIYRSLLIYDDDEMFIAVKKQLSEHDYSFASESNTLGRMYAIRSDWFEECVGKEFIDWDSIDTVFSIGEHAAYIASLFQENNMYVENVIHLL